MLYFVNSEHLTLFIYFVLIVEIWETGQSHNFAILWDVSKELWRITPQKSF